MTDRDHFAAAGLIRGMGVLGYEQIAKSCYEMADAMLRERERTNHDAVPEACDQQSTRLSERSLLARSEEVERGLPRTGNTPSEAEIDALEFVVEEGRTASVDDYGILRSWLIRLRPEWENQSYEESDEKRMNTTMNRDTTPSEGSVQGEGTVGMADIAYETAENVQGVCKTFDQWSRETACVMHRLARHIELLESRVPSDAEREAIESAAMSLDGTHSLDYMRRARQAATLRSLLERLS